MNNDIVFAPGITFRSLASSPKRTNEEHEVGPSSEDRRAEDKSGAEVTATAR